MAINFDRRADERPAPRWIAWPLWVVASALGSALSVAALVGGLAAARAVLHPFDEDDVIGVAVFLSFGACVGLAQWLVLRPSLGRAYWWPVATTAGCVVAYFILTAASPALAGLSTADPWLRALAPLGALGLTIGLCQWLYLRRVVTRAGWWLPISALSWSPLALTALGSSASLEQVAPWLGLVPWVIAGGVLVWLLRRPVDRWPTEHPRPAR